MISGILHRIRAIVWKLLGPKMIYGFRSAGGERRKNTRFGNSTFFQSSKKIIMGDHVYIAHYCFIDGSNGLSIGEGTQVCSYVSLLTHSSHISIRLYGRNYSGSDMIGYQKGSVEIGKYVFIGPHAVVMPGTRIGKGSIVSAFSYVQGDFPDFSIISGNPAKVVGDTRKRDEVFLKDNPELRNYYDQWAIE